MNALQAIRHIARRDMGYSQARALVLTATLLRLCAVSGAFAGDREAALTHFAQAMANGFVRGDEYRALVENAPAITDLLAREMGVTVADLRVRADRGHLFASHVCILILNNRDAVRREFHELPPRIQHAVNRTITNQSKKP